MKRIGSFVAATTGVPRRDRYIISICLAIITVLSWTYLVHLSMHPSSGSEYARMMEAMGMAIGRRWTAIDTLLTFAMWSVMMVGMMSASAAPMLLLFAGAQARREDNQAGLRVGMFGLGYLAVWVGFSGIATIAQWTLHEAALLSDMMAASRPGLAAGILMVAGVYQLTPLKRACLALCRSPLGFLMTNWREGSMGALRMGIRHGLFCIGCCWALMIVLFAVGIMNLVWVAALAVLVLLEKIAPAGPVLSRVAGVAMLAGGLYLLM